MRDLSAQLLDWYDAHARAMPWRTPPTGRKAGARPDPYAVWLSEIMLQQTTVASVTAYFQRFMQRWPNVRALAEAEDEAVMAEWAGLGYYARARNLLKCARLVVETHGGAFPADHAALRALPGIGPYTAAAIGAIAFDLPLTVVDGNVERVMARLHNDPAPLPKAKKTLTAYASALTPEDRPGDYAQAVMDLGATICTPKSPACGICPWREPCRARKAGTAPELPRKSPKIPKPTRHGLAYLACRSDGAWLLERRPPQGLLGGMLGWPGSAWVDKSAPIPQTLPPIDGIWHDVPGEVRHTFTHFHLILHLKVTQSEALSKVGAFYTPAQFRPSDLPTLMRKAFDLARSATNFPKT